MAMLVTAAPPPDVASLAVLPVSEDIGALRALSGVTWQEPLAAEVSGVLTAPDDVMVRRSDGLFL